MQTHDLPDYWKVGTPLDDQKIADQLSCNNPIGAFLHWAECKGVHSECASKYGEPGYSLPEGKNLIIFANWNYVPEEIARLLDETCELEYLDEWVVDYAYDKAWRTSPSSYIWMSSVRYYNGDLLTTDDDPERWAEYLVEGPDRVAPPSVDLESIGFVPCGEIYEHGWHPGQDDNPAQVLLDLGDRLSDKLDPESEEQLQIVFRLTDVGQFDVRWEALYRIVSL
jgi:hypothetical protein